MRAAAVLDLARGRAGADRLRVGVSSQVVARVDDDDRGLRRLRSRDQQNERDQRGDEPHHGQRTTNETATNWDTAAASTST